MDEAISRFKSYLQRRYPDRSTTKHYMSDLSIFRELVGNVSPTEITAKRIDEFVLSQGQQGLKAATINRRLATLASFFDFLIEEAEDDSWHNPVHWKRHGIKRGHHLPRDVSDDTVRRLWAVIDDRRDQAMFTLMLCAGLRVGEVVKLQVQEVPELETAILARLRVCGKGDKERIVWLTSEAMRSVQAWLTERPESQASTLFVNQHGRSLTTNGVRYRLNQYCQQAQVKVTCHQLRHTFARRLAEHNMPIDSLAKLLGHRSLQTTQLYIDGADPTVRRDFEAAMQFSAEVKAMPGARANSSLGPDQFSSAQRANDEQPDPVTVVDKLAHLAADLPDWLHQAVREHTLSRIPRWQPHQVSHQAHNHFGVLCRMGRWLVNHRDWTALEQLRRADLSAYVDAALIRGLKPQSVGAELKVFRGFWRDLLAQERVANGALLLVKAPAATSDHLPRYLTPTEFQRLEQVILAETQADCPQDRFDRAWFYLLAQAGLRRGELLNLRLNDCDLAGKRLRVQAGKGDRDRVLPMTDQLVNVIRDYLAVREPASTDHVLIQRGAPVGRELIRLRLARFGQQAGLERLTPHQLRHTLATFLVNQGMPITSLQKFLGHQDINKTLVYARVYDQTVRQQFAAAMAQIEGIAVADWPTKTSEQVNSPLEISIG